MDSRIIEIVSGILGTPVTEDSTVETVAGWDSLKTLQIVMALDDAGMEVPIEKISEIRSVRDIEAFVQ
ncbi:MAG: acyl carrier protein [Synergistaceae bacterium]|nr:acyl carrier protein [Synergistaceae bacterium]